MIPRDGGNTFSGSLFSGYQNQSFQTDNLTDGPEGPRPEDAATASTSCANIEGSLGGPIKKDKIWFFGSARAFHLDTLPADALVGIPGTALPEPCADAERPNAASIRRASTASRRGSSGRSARRTSCRPTTTGSSRIAART